MLLSQGCVLQNGPHCGNGGPNVDSKDGGGGEEPLIARVQFTGQPAVTSSPWPPLTATTTLYSSRTSSSCPKDPLCPSAISPYSHLTPAPGNHYPTFCFHDFAFPGHSVSMGSCNTWPFVSAIFHPAGSFQDWPVLGGNRHFIFSWPNSVPRRRRATLCVSIHQLIEIWLAPAFWLLHCYEHIRTTFLCAYMFLHVLDILT